MAGYLPFAGLANSGYDYGKDFNSALQMNAANYANVYSGFGDLLARQQAGNAAIESGYTERRNNAMGLLAGLEQGQREDIEAGATRATSSNAQNLIGRGLGNTTVTSTLARGVEADKNRSVNDLVGKMAGMKSNIYAALDGDRLQASQSLNDRYNQIARDRLAFQERVSAPYPDAGKYAALQQQRGANAMAGAGMGGGMPRQMPGAGGMRGNFGIQPAPMRGGNPGNNVIPGAMGGGMNPGGGFQGIMPPGIAQGGMDGGYGAILGGIGTVDPCLYGDCGDAPMGSGGYGDPTMGAGGMFGSGGYSGMPTGTGYFGGESVGYGDIWGGAYSGAGAYSGGGYGWGGGS